jgi:intracellular septation protein A
MTILSLILLGAFLTISLRTMNDFYFKTYGAIVNIISSLAMLVTWYFFHRAMILEMVINSGALPLLNQANPEIKPESMQEVIRVFSQQFPFWLIIHSLLVIYAAVNWSNKAWVWVRVFGFFLVTFLSFYFSGLGVIEFTNK